MKNQTDLITSIVAGVVAIIGVVIIFMTKREPVKPAEAPTVKLTAPSIPKDNVVTYANGLGGGTNTGMGGGYPGMAGGRGPMGMGGGPMGMMPSSAAGGPGGPMMPMGAPPMGSSGAPMGGKAGPMGAPMGK